MDPRNTVDFKLPATTKEQRNNISSPGNFDKDGKPKQNDIKEVKHKINQQA